MRDVKRFCVIALVWLSASGLAWAQSPETPGGNTTTTTPAVSFGIVSFLQYAAELHEQDGYNAFEVTRGYFDVKARLSDRVRVRFTTDADLTGKGLMHAPPIFSIVHDRLRAHAAGFVRLRAADC